MYVVFQLYIVITYHNLTNIYVYKIGTSWSKEGYKEGIQKGTYETRKDTKNKGNARTHNENWIDLFNNYNLYIYE